RFPACVWWKDAHSEVRGGMYIRRCTGTTPRMRRLAVAAVVALTGCSTSVFDSGVDYKTQSTLPPLEVPPDLTAPSRDSRFNMPDSRQSATLSGYQQERKEQGRPGATGVLPQVEAVRFERSGSERWLVVAQEPPERVWPIVREFWLE